MKVLVFGLFLALTPFLSADTIDYSGAGQLSNHTASQSGSPSAGRSWSVTTQLVEVNDTTTGMVEQGQLGHVDISTGRLSACGSDLCFTGGSLDITNPTGGVIFDMAFTSGTVSKIDGNTFLNAVLPSGGTTQIESSAGVFSSNSVITATTTTVPEPAGLFLMGSGLLGLSFLKRFIN